MMGLPLQEAFSCLAPVPFPFLVDVLFLFFSVVQQKEAGTPEVPWIRLSEDFLESDSVLTDLDVPLGSRHGQLRGSRVFLPPKPLPQEENMGSRLFIWCLVAV